MEGRPDASPTTKSIDADGFSPKVNFAFRNDKDTTTFLSVSRLWRSPSMAEFYWWSVNQTAPMPGAVIAGDIKPEKGWGYEIGIEHKLSPAFTTKLTGYYQNIDDYINFTHQFPFSCYNIDNARLWGFEWENNYQLDDQSRFFLHYTNQHTKKTGVDPGDNLGLHNELDYRPRHKVAVGYHYDAKPWQFWYTIQYTGEQTANYPYGTADLLRLGGYTTHTVSLTRELTSDSSLTVAIDNLFDKYYVEQNNYPMPGRLLSATFKQKI
jgi:outer membrane receptor protein involved in Fe transport